MATIICPNCGKSIPKGSATCPNCGYQLTQIKVPHSSQKSIKKQIQVRGSNWFAHFKQAGYFLLKGKWLTAFLSLFLICLVGYLFQQYQLYQREFRIQQQLTQATNSLKHQSQIMAKQQPPIQEHLRKIPQDPKQPILVLHGFGGSYNSERYLVASLEQTHLAKQQLMVDVDRHSHIHLIGKYRPTVTHKVIIPIVIENNRAGEFYYSAMLAKIMPKLNHRYHIKKYDAIGHSMGSYAWINYFETHPKQVAQIKPHRLVTIAGPFNGILNRHKSDQPAANSKVGRLWDDHVNENSLAKKGRPKIERAEYKHLLKAKHRLPTDLSILNIYGNLKDGSNSDGLVTTTSARSLRYLVQTSNVKISYQEKQITGPKAQHSLLHYNNLTVNHLIKEFLLH